MDALTPDQAERALAEGLSQKLAIRLAPGKSVKVMLSGDESGVQYAFPATVAKLLVKILSKIAKGNAVIIVPISPELTTREAAEWLNVSQPYLIGLLEQGQLPFYNVGDAPPHPTG